MDNNDILSLLQQAKNLDQSNDMVLRQAGSALMELIMGEQPLAAIALLVALPESVLYAPHKAGFGILYWTCNIPGPLSGLVLKALFLARPELFEDFMSHSDCSSHPLHFDAPSIPLSSDLSLAPIHPHQRLQEQEAHPIYWTINLSNPHALQSLLSIGVQLQYEHLYLACSKAEGFCAMRIYEHCLQWYDRQGGPHPIEYIVRPHGLALSALEILEAKIETLLPSSDHKRGASIALQYFYSQNEARKIEQSLHPHTDWGSSTATACTSHKRL